MENDIRSIHSLQVCLNEKYNLFYAKDGQEGINLSLKQIPDLIISSIYLNLKNGCELCEILKKDERSSHIPIILLSPPITYEDRIRGLRSGADAFLFKPVRKEELLIRVEKLLALRLVLHRHFELTNQTSISNNVLEMETSFIQKVNSIIDKELCDVTFSHKILEQLLYMSRTQLYRKIKALTGKSVAIYIRSRRLKKANYLLKNSQRSISEIAYLVGFKNPSHLSRYFKSAYGLSPKQSRNQQEK
ncbi:MAG: helix-turn-helix domain-containing protein [Bacteroidia bacterium]|nr:helix-turn-helix domain-containing protein [Bacteroidia bacterium]